MKKAAAHPTTKPLVGRASLTAGDIGLQFLDTTWRIAVPAVGGTLLGIWGDKALGSKPWLTFLGAISGFAIAGWLVKRELDAALRREDNE